jgi:hypothetical protein
VSGRDPAPAFTLVTRVDCHLCDAMHEELQRYFGSGGAAVRILDVDRDPDLQRRFGHKVPVLMLDDEVVCSGRFDRAEVERLTRSRQ